MATRPFNNPFAERGKELKKKLAKEAKERERAEIEALMRAKTAKEREREAPAGADDASLFLRAMAGTERRNKDPRGRVVPPLPPPDAAHVPVHDEEAEALAELASLVDGTGHFDIADSDEFIEGGVEGLDRRILKKLRNGDYAVGPHLDLHGLTREPAREAVEQFLAKARRDGDRCVLIVHGRGLNSKDNIPVLKGLLKGWLERGRIARSILAFCTARPHDGGTGAVYVLLRR